MDSKSLEESLKPWGRQKFLIENKYRKGVPSMKEVIEIAESIDDLRVRALFILCYFTAGRITEVININVDDISLDEIRGRKVWKIRMINLKNKTRQSKEIPVLLDREENLMLAKHVNEYVKSLMSKKLFEFGRDRAEQLLNKHIHFNPHFIRHIRLTHLVTVYNFSDELLVRYAGWTDSKPANRYVNLRTEDFLDKL
jgi:integrase